MNDPDARIWELEAFADAVHLAVFPSLVDKATPSSAAVIATRSLPPNGSPRNSAAAATPTTGVSKVDMEAVSGASLRTAANQVM